MKSTVPNRIAKLRASIGSTSRKTSFAQALDAGLSLKSARTLRNLQSAGITSARPTKK